MASYRHDPRALYAPNPTLAALKNLGLVGQPPFRLDEGYSEDTRSQSGASDAFRMDSGVEEVMEQDIDQILPDWLLAMTEEQRSEFAYLVLRSLRTSSIAGIVDKLNPLLHIDPGSRLPNEIIFEILNHLDPVTLLRVSVLSRAWRARALDSRLWRRLFSCEGWTPDLRNVRSFEQAERSRKHTSRVRKLRERTSDAGIDRHISKKRAKEPPRLFGDGTTDSGADAAGPTDWAQQAEPVEADEPSTTDNDDTMQDVAYQQPQTPQDEHMMSPPLPPAVEHMSLPVKPGLLLEEAGHDPRMNWQYLYKQKRRLEENWNAGRFTNFQIPHPNHTDEAHTECVYTIQYSTDHLVSGSRDRTIRIWDLETQRLLRTLRGHTASVLCLHFDERPEQDLVASGGSDAHVILWRFSTGEVIRHLSKAHTESVLNLRFDDRFLITCSKDKTIKVWNRRSLMPGDADYPNPTGSSAKYPSYIINMEDVATRQSLLSGVKPLEPFTHLMTLHGHTAAVNAIQVLDGQIVSASGDRTVKVWEVKSGICLKTISGHLKGIACVQYDGRRIVSGSSDDSVRIFDRVTGAEVACLRGHSNLVRTVQARFGDMPGNEEELEAEARAVDQRYFQARARGDIPTELTREQRHARNAGSSRPQDIWAWGAKIPPGGGGSKWARIVSGSYDESVIIWKRNSEGRWTAAQKLHQWEAVINAGGRPRNFPGHGQQPHHQLHAQAAAAANVAAQQQQQQQQQQHQHQPAAPPAVAQALVTQAQAQLAQAHSTIAQAQHIVHQHAASTVTTTSTSTPTTQQPSSTAAAAGSATTSNPSATATPPAPAHHHHHHHPQQATSSTTAPGSTQLQPQQLPHHPNPANAQATSMPTPQPQPQPQQPQQPQQQAQPNNAPAAAPHHHQAQQPPQPQHHHHHHHHHAPGAGVGAAGGAGQGGTNSRVFKLQFDSRRIICCSQDPIIVGWDFANGDEEIVAASRFFGEEL